MNKTLSLLPEHFLRNFIGLDLLNEKISNYPPHNIERVNQDVFVLTLAVAGFKHSDLSAYVQGGKLMVEGRIIPEPTETPVLPTEYLYQGISFRNFKQVFTLGGDVDVTSIVLKNGLLEIVLQRQVPESEKPKYLKIK